MIEVLYCFVLHIMCWGIIAGDCPGVNSKSVSWWIIYQQKQRPFLHYYIDNTDINQITPHFPETEDSVLSNVISPLINDGEMEHMVYTSDLINAVNIARQNNIPMYSKLIHGIIASRTSWNSGFWILHNNLFFPPIEDGKLKLPGGKEWMLATMGDSMSDMFYICLSAGTKTKMSRMIKQMLTGNPIIIMRKLSEDSINNLNLQAVTELKGSFWLYWSASFFMNCMYAADSEIKTQCLFNYTMNIETEVVLYTRPRGMVRQGMSFCYNGQSKSSYEWVEMRATTTNNQDWRNSMFTLTDQSSTSLSGLTCFGQDIGANTETVAIMVCFRLPKLYKTLLRMSKVTQWSCQKNRQVAEQNPTKHRNRESLSLNKGIMNKQSQMKQPDNLNNQNKSITKYCSTVVCKANRKHETKTVKRYSFEKNSKLKQRFLEMTSSVQLQSNLLNPVKTSKQRKYRKYTKIIRTLTDIQKFVTANEHAVLGLFCKDGCRFCQKAKQEFKRLGRLSKLQLDDLDIIIIDVNHPGLPSYLRPPWTPFIRFKVPGIGDKWIDYKNGQHTFYHILQFLQSAYQSVSSLKTVSITEKNVLNGTSVQAAEHNNKIYKEFNKSTFTRRKRDVDHNFVWKHLWPVRDSDLFQKFNNSHENRWITLVVCSRLVRLAKYNNELLKDRPVNTFIVFNGKLTDFKTLLDRKIKKPKAKDSLFTQVTLSEFVNILLIEIRMHYLYDKGNHNLIIKSIIKGTKGTFKIGKLRNGTIIHLEGVMMTNEQKVFPFHPNNPPGTCGPGRVGDNIAIHSDLKNTGKKSEDINKIDKIEEECKSKIDQIIF